MTNHDFLAVVLILLNKNNQNRFIKKYQGSLVK